MRRALLLLVAIVCVSTAAVVSMARPDRPDAQASSSESKFIIASESKNPWTSLTPNIAPDQFQFAIISDRTGGHRAGIFGKAVQQINLLQPEFVMSVGDLIEGQTTAEGNIKEWDEFDGYVKQFKMPFFYCPGNHDAMSKVKLTVYSERYGRPYYHFLYKNCLFVVLNSNDPINLKGETVYRGDKIGKDQLAWLDGVLKENPAPRWTFVFLHHPIWAIGDFTESGWLECEKLLAGRKHNVFCGHLHRFRMYKRNGTNYYQLATTGGGSTVRGVEYGEFDQCAWVTMKGAEPIISNVVLGGVLNHDLSPIESAEIGRYKEPDANTLAEVIGKVTFDGKPPPPGWQINFTEIVAKPVPDPKKPGQFKPGYSGNSRLAEDGSYIVYAYRGTMGVKPGRYAVTFSPAPSRIVDPKVLPENTVPEKYRTVSKTPLRVTVENGVRNQHNFALTSE